MQARKPEWLAENLDNPFRNWDGRENISSTNVKKAHTQYKNTRSKILGMISDFRDNKNSEQLLIELLNEVSVFTELFNKINKRSDFIETMESEKIFEALSSIVGLVNNEIGNIVDIKLLYDKFDEVRDF